MHILMIFTHSANFTPDIKTFGYDLEVLKRF